MKPGFSAAHATTALLRVGAGLLFMMHGAQKLFGWFGGIDGAGSSVSLLSQLGAAGVVELLGGSLFVIGLLTRGVALVLIGEMIVAYFQVHAPQAMAPIQNGGELALLYALIFCYFAGHGAGSWSVDALRTRPSDIGPPREGEGADTRWQEQARRRAS